MSNDKSPLETKRSATWNPSAGVRRSLLAIALAAPMAMMGCTAPAADDGTGASEEAFTRKTISEGSTLRVTASALNLRSSPGMTGAVIASMKSGDIVTCAADSGSDGWVNVTTVTGKTGWASLTYLAETKADDNEETGQVGEVDGDTCSPERATGVVNAFQKALHDTIAFAEGTRNNGEDGYNIIFSGIRITSCNKHPNRCIKFGSTCSTAAGRYQFLSGTWNSIRSVRGYATFEPENQELGAAYLITGVRKATIPTNRALSAAEFENVITKLSFEWASLPPGQYGQPMRSMSTMRSTYCTLTNCD
jgi:muramidase (phage lysozyme)